MSAKEFKAENLQLSFLFLFLKCTENVEKRAMQIGIHLRDFSSFFLYLVEKKKLFHFVSIPLCDSDLVVMEISRNLFSNKQLKL